MQFSSRRTQRALSIFGGAQFSENINRQPLRAKRMLRVTFNIAHALFPCFPLLNRCGGSILLADFYHST